MGMREKLIELVLRMDITDNVGNIVDFLVANGVEIPVRCKDCKHWKDSWVAPDGKHEHGYCYMEDADDVVVGRWGDDFCSYGERRTDE